MCERPGGRKQVAAGDRESVHVHERDRAGNVGTLADEDRTPLDLDPELLPAHLGHAASVTDIGTAPTASRAFTLCGTESARRLEWWVLREVPGSCTATECKTLNFGRRITRRTLPAESSLQLVLLPA